MKNKEEIEQLANEYGYASAYSKEEHKAFIQGYTQCQQYMADNSIRFAEWLMVMEQLSKNYKITQHLIFTLYS
jgi:hypothetical protein